MGSPGILIPSQSAPAYHKVDNSPAPKEGRDERVRRGRGEPLRVSTLAYAAAVVATVLIGQHMALKQR